MDVKRRFIGDSCYAELLIPAFHGAGVYLSGLAREGSSAHLLALNALASVLKVIELRDCVSSFERCFVDEAVCILF